MKDILDIRNSMMTAQEAATEQFYRSVPFADRWCARKVQLVTALSDPFFKRCPGGYIPPGEEDTRTTTLASLDTDEWYPPMILCGDNWFDFMDGRHRWCLLRDRGCDWIPVVTTRLNADRLETWGLTLKEDEKETRQ